MKDIEQTNNDPDKVLEFDKDSFIKGMESAGLQLSDRPGSPLAEIQANIEWAQSLPEDAVIKYDGNTGRVFRDLGKISLEIDES